MHRVERDLMMDCLTIESQLFELAKCKETTRQGRAAQQCALFSRMEIAMMAGRNSQTVEGVDRASRARVSIILGQS